MRKVLGISIALIGLCVVGSLGATAVLDEAPAEPQVPAVPQTALPWELPFTQPAAEGCAASAILDGVKTAGSCVPQNQVCRSPWFNGECCAGSTCTFLYPNVPWYCL